MKTVGATRSRASADPWRRIRGQVACCYVLGLLVILARYGVPTSRMDLMAIVIVGLAITAIGRGRKAILGILLDWLPFTLVLLVYDVSRSVADIVNLPVHQGDVAHAERWFFGGTVPTVWLQQHFYTPSAVHPYDAVMTLIYTSHFLATPILAAVLWLRDRSVWVAYVRRVVVLAFAGLVTYVAFPEAPPWMASRAGVIGPVHRLSARGWEWLHLGNVHELLEAAQRDGSNPVAAMPSLHTSFAALIALFLADRVRSRWTRKLLGLYPVAMGLALVYLGEHYVLDVVVGVVYAVAVHVGVSRWEARRAEGRQSPGNAEEELVLADLDREFGGSIAS